MSRDSRQSSRCDPARLLTAQAERDLRSLVQYFAGRILTICRETGRAPVDIRIDDGVDGKQLIVNTAELPADWYEKRRDDG